MPINVVVKPQHNISVRKNPDGSVIVAKIGTVGSGPSSTTAQSLANLTDVVFLDESNGNILVYNSANSSFILEDASHANFGNNLPIDGGSF